MINLGLLTLDYTHQSNRANASVVIPASNSAVTPTSILPEQDGIYLYSQSSKPNQLGQGYIIFQKQQERVIGALYMPQSEFSCFQGNLSKSGNLALTVTSSPGESGVMEVSTASTIPKINDNDSVTYDYSILLKDYYQLKSLSQNDTEVLQKCRQLQTPN